MAHSTTRNDTFLANQRFRAQRRAEEITTSLHQIGLAIASSRNLEQVLRLVVEGALRMIGADSATLYLYDKAADEFSFPVGVGVLDEEEFIQSRPKSDRVATKIAKERKRLVADEVIRHPDFRQLKFPQREGVVSSAGFPLVVRDSVVGVLFVHFRTPHHFSPEDEQLIATFADQAAVAIDNAQLYERMTSNVARLEVLHQIKSHLDSVFKFNDILQVILWEGLTAVQADEGSVMLVDSETNQLEIRAWVVKGEFVPSKEHRTLDMGQGIAGQVAATGKVYNCPDTSRDDHFVSSFMGRDIGSLLSVPIMSHGKVIGVINAEHPEPNFFRKDDEQFLSTLADHAAVAIESYRLRDLGMALSATLNREAVAELVVERTRELIDCDACTIYHLDAGTRMLIPMASRGEYAEENMAFAIELGKGIAGSVAESGVGEIVNQAHLDPRAVQVPGTPDIPASLLVEPLLVKGHVIGAIALDKLGEKAFYDSDARLLSTIAAQAALALDNARLFEVSQERMKEIQQLAEVGQRILISPFDLRRILQDIVNQAVAALRADLVILYLYHQARREFELPTIRVGTFLEPEFPEHTVVDENALAAKIVISGAPRYAPDAATDELLSGVPSTCRPPGAQPFVARERISSSAGIPLKVANEIVGVMFVNYRAPRAFDDR